MVVCGCYMFEFSVSKDMKKWLIKGGGIREGSGTFVSNANCQGMNISVEQGRVATTLNIINTLNILFSVVIAT